MDADAVCAGDSRRTRYVRWADDGCEQRHRWMWTDEAARGRLCLTAADGDVCETDTAFDTVLYVRARVDGNRVVQ